VETPRIPVVPPRPPDLARGALSFRPGAFRITGIPGEEGGGSVARLRAYRGQAIRVIPNGRSAIDKAARSRLECLFRRPPLGTRASTAVINFLRRLNEIARARAPRCELTRKRKSAAARESPPAQLASIIRLCVFAYLRIFGLREARVRNLRWINGYARTRHKYSRAAASPLRRPAARRGVEFLARRTMGRDSATDSAIYRVASIRHRDIGPTSF